MTWPQSSQQTPYDRNRARWMTQLGDELRISDLSIPGTHDSAALADHTHFRVSETQQWKIEDQLANGIRFLDLRVKRKQTSDELAMWHGSDFIWDPYKPGSSDQLYLRKVIDVCVRWLRSNPKETIILSVKDEENSWDQFWSATAKELGKDVYQILTEVNQQHEASTNPNFHGMWHGHTVDCQLKDVRGRLVLWQRFASPNLGDDASFPGVNFTEMNGKLDNTKGAKLHDGHGEIAYIQDVYGGSFKEKMESWLDLANRAHDSRRDPNNADKNLQFLNFGSKAGGKPRDSAKIINPLITKWLSQMTARPAGPSRWPNDPTRSGNPDDWHFRSGYGVIPLDFPDQTLIDTIIHANFSKTYQTNAFQSGSALWGELVAAAAKSD